MVGIDKFEKMSLFDQGVILISEGKHLSQVKRDDFLVNLYSLDDFFVEVYYSIHTNRIEKIEVMSDHSRLDIYIDEKLKKEKLRLN